jgi:3-hydroxy acid dehydrogenase/malonic semialdehyde reductase
MTNIVFITGATAGIGWATALLFAQQGWDIIATGRRKERLDELCTQVQSQYPTIKILPLVLDVRSNEQVQKTIANLPQNWQHIRVLVNNAGLAAGLNTIENADTNDWDTMIDTNIKGLLYVTRAVVPLMIEHKTQGHIVNLSSIAGKEVYLRGNVYCATKHAVEALTKSTRIDLLPYGIKVTGISPGAVETEFSIVRYKGDEEKAKQMYMGYTPLNANDIADTIWYAVSRPKHVNIGDITITCNAQANVYYWDKNQQN